MKFPNQNLKRAGVLKSRQHQLSLNDDCVQLCYCLHALCETVECQKKKKPALGSDNKNIQTKRVNDDDLGFPNVRIPAVITSFCNSTWLERERAYRAPSHVELECE